TALLRGEDSAQLSMASWRARLDLRFARVPTPRQSSAKGRPRMNVCSRLVAISGAVLLGFGGQAAAADVDHQRLLKADKEPDNWMTYHGSYNSWHYSALKDINTTNVKQLKVAWSHVASRSTRGLQSYPLAVDGVLYYSGSYNQVWALDGATGEVRWQYKQKLNDDLVAKQTHSPHNRGIAIGYGNVYMGTLDGKLVAIDMSTGKLKWETKLVNSEKLTVGVPGGGPPGEGEANNDAGGT